jgi:hypothetical protein
VPGRGAWASEGLNLAGAMRAGERRPTGACARCSRLPTSTRPRTTRTVVPENPWGVDPRRRDLGEAMVRRVVARRVLPDRPPSWADLLTYAQWETLRPAFRADRRLQAECRVLLLRLPEPERAAFVTELAAHLRGKRRPPHALGLAIEAAAQRSLRPRRAQPLLVTPRRRR